MIHGFALIDKPAGWTSHDVVGRLRRLYGQKRVGHAGTLDPMATGVLVVGLGHATRMLRFVQGQPKTYEATIRIGVGTVTDDAEGEVVEEPGWEWDPAGLSAAISRLTGDIAQVPSAVSAVKFDGVRSYARVRRGEQVELAARPVTIHRFEVTSPPRIQGRSVDVDVVVECSSGTYIRALARDVGDSLGSAAHLTSLRRTAIGPIEVGECAALGDQAPPVVDTVEVMSRLLPVLSAGPAVAHALRNGLLPQLDIADGIWFVVADEQWVSVIEVVDRSPTILVNRPS